MSERIEHVERALNGLRVADRDVSENWPLQTGEAKADILAVAQIHATLALVEQQRIANLIALAALTYPDGTHVHASSVVEPGEYVGSYRVREDIREGLGL